MNRPMKRPMKRLVIALFMLAPTAAHAGGLFVPGAGPQAQARAGAFVAKADDGSALFHNPAGFAKLTGTVVYVGVNLVSYSLDYTRAGHYEDTGNGESYIGAPYPTVSDESSPIVGVGPFQAIPLVAVSTDMGKPDLNLRIAGGIIAPQAHPNRKFKQSHDLGGADLAPGPQRYDSIEQSAETALPSLAIAYRPMPKLDIGVRASWGIAELNAKTATWGIRNYEEWEEKDGVFSIDVKDNFVPAWGAGVLFRPSSSFEIGAAYHSALHIRAKGEGSTILGTAVDPLDPDAFIEAEDRPQFIDCELGGEDIVALKSCLDLDLPQFATVGGRWVMRDDDGSEKADVEIDVRWENWSADKASEYEVRVDGKSSTGGFVLNPATIGHRLEDVWSVRVGGSYTTQLGGSDMTYRLGVAHDTKTAKLSYVRVDFDSAPRTTFGLGAAYTFAGGKYRLDLGGGYVYEPTRKLAQCLPPDGPDLSRTSCSGDDLPAKDRIHPDPAQPLSDANSAFESPFNAGKYESSYLLFSLGLAASF